MLSGAKAQILCFAVIVFADNVRDKLTKVLLGQGEVTEKQLKVITSAGLAVWILGLLKLLYNLQSII